MDEREEQRPPILPPWHVPSGERMAGGELIPGTEPFIHYTLSSFALAKAASASLALPRALRATPLLFQVAATAV